MTGLNRVWGIVAHPREAFADIDLRSAWLLPLVLILVVNLATNFVVYRVLTNDANFDRVARMKVRWDAAASGKSLSEAEIERQEATLRKQRNLWFLVPLYSVPASVLAIAIFFWFVLAIARAGATFGKIFAVVCWSLVIYRVLGGIVTIAVLLLRGPGGFQPAPPEAWSPVSLGRVVPRTAVTPNEFSAISKLDPFLIWWLALMALGFARTSRNLTLRKSVLIVTLTEIVYLILNAAGLLPGAS